MLQFYFPVSKNHLEDPIVMPYNGKQGGGILGITIKELAKISGYSTATISRVLSNQSNVKPETREAIEKLLEEYQYRTNIMEIRQERQKKNKILVITPELYDYWLAGQIKGIKEEASRNGYITLIVYSDHSIETEEEYVEMAIQEKYAGVILLNMNGREQVAEKLRSSKIPAVILNEPVKYPGINAVYADHYQGSYLLTSYLIEMGHRKIGYIMGDSYLKLTQDRWRGYEDAMHARNLFITNSNLLSGKMTFDDGYKAAERIIKKGLDYTAVICNDYHILFGFMSALQEFGIRVPEDFSVVCNDDSIYAEYLGITCVEGMERIESGKRTMKCLLSKIQGRESYRDTIVYQPKLVIRKSVRKL